MTAPDVPTVRQLATEHILEDARRAHDIGAAVLGHHGPYALTKHEYGAWCSAIREAIRTAQIAVSWPDEQPTTEQGPRDRVVQAAVRDLGKLADAWLAWFDSGQDGEPPAMPERRIEIADHLGRVRIVLTELKLLREDLEAARIRLDLLALPVSAEGLRALLAVVEQQPAEATGGEVKCGRECSEMHTYVPGECEAAVSAEAAGGEQAQDGAAADLRAWLASRAGDDQLGRDVLAVLDNREVWRNLARSRGAERDALAARVAELEGEREADTRVVTRLIETADAHYRELAVAMAVDALRARFADRIAALDDDAAPDGRSGPVAAPEASGGAQQ